MRLSLLTELQRPQGIPDYSAVVQREAMEQICLADEAGFNTIWVTEHHFLNTFCDTPANDVFLGAVSQRTKRIRLGLGAVILPYHHPLHVAERVAVLDILSGGRVEFGTGRGGVYEQVGNGTDPREARARWDESLRMVADIWQTDGEYSHEGKYWSIPPRVIVPKPLQKPHPPIWLACTSKDSYGFAADHGIGVMEFDSHPPATVARDIQHYREQVEQFTPAGGRIYSQWASAVSGLCGPDNDKARRSAHASARSLFGPGKPYAAAATGLFQALLEQWGDDAPEDFRRAFLRSNTGADFTGAAMKSVWDRLSADNFCDSGTLVGGDPESCLRALAQHHKAGADEVILIMQTQAVTHDDVMQSIELLGKHVIPEIKKWDAPVQVGAVS